MDYKNRFNTKIKVYPDGNFKATYCNKCIFTDDKNRKKNSSSHEPIQDWEVELHKTIEEECSQELIEDVVPDKPKDKNKSSLNVERSIKRAKEKIFDIVYLNDFKYFVTINFDPDKVDSRNAKEVMKKLKVWLEHQTQRNGMQYLLVPEYHPDSCDGVKDRIHCHALITDYPKNLLVHAVVHSKGGGVKYNSDGTRKLMYDSRGQPIYNMLGWKYGFSTCIPIYRDLGTSNIKLAHYITKYVTKDIKSIFGKYYWSSKGLVRDVDTRYYISDYESLPLKEYEIPNTSLKLKYDSQFDYVLGGE